MISYPAFIAENTISETAKSMEESANFAKKTLDQLGNWMMGKMGSVIIAVIFILIGLKIVGLFLKFLKKLQELLLLL